MSKIIGFLWLFIGVIYIFDMLEPTRFTVIIMCLCLAVYEFTNKY